MLLRSHCELINEDSKPLPARDRVIDRPCDLRLRYLRVADIKPMTTTYSCLLDAFSELRMATLSFSKLVWSLFGGSIYEVSTVAAGWDVHTVVVAWF